MDSILSSPGCCHAHNNSFPQVCSILWSPHYKELISGHGFAQNQLVIWKYPTMAKVAELKGRWQREARQRVYIVYDFICMKC